MNEKINKKWLIDTLLEGFVPSIVIILAVVFTCDKGYDDFRNDWNYGDFIAFICILSLVSYLALCFVKYKTIDFYAKLTAFIYTALMGTTTYLFGDIRYREYSIPFSNLVFIILISMFLWFIFQYKRLDFSK